MSQSSSSGFLASTPRYDDYVPERREQVCEQSGLLTKVSAWVRGKIGGLFSKKSEPEPSALEKKTRFKSIRGYQKPKPAIDDMYVRAGWMTPERFPAAAPVIVHRPEISADQPRATPAPLPPPQPAIYTVWEKDGIHDKTFSSNTEATFLAMAADLSARRAQDDRPDEDEPIVVSLNSHARRMPAEHRKADPVDVLFAGNTGSSDVLSDYYFGEDASLVAMQSVAVERQRQRQARSAPVRCADDFWSRQTHRRRAA